MLKKITSPTHLHPKARTDGSNTDDYTHSHFSSIARPERERDRETENVIYSFRYCFCANTNKCTPCLHTQDQKKHNRFTTLHPQNWKNGTLCHPSLDSQRSSRSKVAADFRCSSMKWNWNCFLSTGESRTVQCTCVQPEVMSSPVYSEVTNKQRLHKQTILQHPPSTNSSNAKCTDLVFQRLLQCS